MKVLELLQNSFTIVGIKRYHPSKKSPLNVTNSIFLFALCLRFCSSALYLLIEADSFEEYINSGLLVSADFIGILIFASAVYETPNLYQFFDSLGHTIQTSKIDDLSKKQSINPNCFPFINKRQFVIIFHRTGFKYPVSKRIYTKADDTSFKWLKIIEFAVVKIAPICMVAPVSVTSICFYYATDQVIYFTEDKN